MTISISRERITSKQVDVDRNAVRGENTEPVV